MRRDIAGRTCAQFGVLSPAQVKNRLEHELEPASGNEARRARAAVLTRVGSISGLNRTEREALAYLVEVAPVFADEMGNTIFGPTSRNRKALAEAIGVSASTVGRAWTKLIDMQLIARVYEKRDADTKRRFFEYAINARKILSLSVSSKEAFTMPELQGDPFADLHKKSRKLYIAVAREPSQTLGFYAKKLECSKDTVRRARGDLLAVGAIGLGQARFEVPDGAGVFQTVERVIAILEQGGVCGVIHLEGRGLVCKGQLPHADVDRDVHTARLARQIEQLVADLWRDDGQSQPVFTRVVEENSGKAGADDPTDPILHKPPDRMFAARATAEIVADDEDRCFGPRRCVEYEVGPRPARLVEPQIGQRAV